MPAKGCLRAATYAPCRFPTWEARPFSIRCHAAAEAKPRNLTIRDRLRGGRPSRPAGIGRKLLSGFCGLASGTLEPVPNSTFISGR